MKILVVAPNWIGDAVMSLSLLQALHRDDRLASAGGEPCEIHVLAPPVTAPVYRCSPVVKAVHVEPFKHGELQLTLRRKVGQALRAEGFKRAYILPNSLKSALVPWFADIAWRTGYSGELRSLILTPVLPKPSKYAKPPMLEWYGALGGYTAADLEYPRMQVEGDASAKALRDFDLNGGFLAVAPGAEYGPAKRWPAEHVAATVSGWLAAHPARVAVLLGGPQDLEFAQSIEQKVDPEHRQRVRVLCGQTSLEQAFGLIASATALLTNDSGLMHVAAALDVKVHAVFGSSSPHHTPPLNTNASVYYLALSCSPCYQRTCPLGHLDCLNQLKPKLVLDQLVPPGQGV